MRIGLLSTLAATGDGLPRAFMRLGGRELIAWQMDLAKTLGCERLLILSDGENATQVRVSAIAKSASLDAEFIGGPRHLLGKATADQDIVAIADGLVIDPELALKHFGSTRGVAALADYPAVEQGFERIDPEHAWAGLLVTRGSAAEMLSQMPSDGDTMSLLLRLALQAGTRLVSLDEMHLGTGEILLARNEEALAEREKSLLDHSKARVDSFAPGETLAAMIARSLAPDGLAKGPIAGLALGAFLLSAGLGAVFYDYILPGFTLVLFGVFSIAVSQAFRFLRARLHGALVGRRLTMAINAVVDASIILALALNSEALRPVDAIFVPVVFVGLWRLAAPLSPARLRGFWRDRTVLAIIALMIAGTGIQASALPIIALGLLVFCLTSEAASRLTRV